MDRNLSRRFTAIRDLQPIDLPFSGKSNGRVHRISHETDRVFDLKVAKWSAQLLDQLCLVFG